MMHTPGPWAYDENRDAILVNENKEITKLLLTGVRQPLGNHPSIDEAKDNAKYIVRCVNSHAALLEALKHCVLVFRSMSDRGAYPQELLPFDINDQTQKSSLFLGKQGFRFAIEAIAQAEGGA